MWKLFPQVLHICIGNDNDEEGGYGFEYLGIMTTLIQNYISKGADMFTQVGPEQTQSYIDMTMHAVQRVLVINSGGMSKQDGTSAMRIFLSILETFPGSDVTKIVNMLLAEIHKAFGESTPKNYKSMLIQTLSMCFWNNSQVTLAVVE